MTDQQCITPFKNAKRKRNALVPSPLCHAQDLVNDLNEINEYAARQSIKVLSAKHWATDTTIFMANK